MRGICEKPRIKCSECPHQRFLSVTEDVIRWHLCGHDNRGVDFVMGVYPMWRDETGFLLAADFDKATWQADAGAFWETCRQMNVPAALERSRSGHGSHGWFFFEEAVPATVARKLGAYRLTKTRELRPEQALAAQALLTHDTGVLAATTAFGKTVVAAWLIAQRALR